MPITFYLIVQLNSRAPSGAITQFLRKTLQRISWQITLKLSCWFKMKLGQISVVLS